MIDQNKESRDHFLHFSAELIGLDQQLLKNVETCLNKKDLRYKDRMVEVRQYVLYNPRTRQLGANKAHDASDGMS